MEFDKKEFDPISKRGNSHKHSKRTIVNAILYVVKGGIQWRLMPMIFLPGRLFTIILVVGTSVVSGRNAWIG
ncbi:transposase [Nitrosomonas communis]|uniref:transposase n=1 Tax=Nitrosomonas communis TaxID=44574 RepID=UPI000941E500